MAVTRYRLRLLKLEDVEVTLQPQQLVRVLRAWRKHKDFATHCTACRQEIPFGEGTTFTLCCDRFYYNQQLPLYPVKSLAMPTPGYTFMLPQLRRMMEQKGIPLCSQEFIVIPDPVFWQVTSTITFEKVAKFVQGQPMTVRTRNVLPPSQAPYFYQQMQEASLNYGSLESRSCGKATLFRQHVFGKRCKGSMRGMIVPDPSLRPNEIRMPRQMAHLEGRFVLFNRQPTLHPGNFVALKVARDSWRNDCFGIPLEILKSLSGDFDGDEINGFVVNSHLSQAECVFLLNSEYDMGSFVTGLKLSPCQDMLVAYHRFYDEIDFLPYKRRGRLEQTLRVIYDLYGSKVTFETIDRLRRFYLSKQVSHPFALTLAELPPKNRGCLVTQVKAGAKGSMEHLKQMFGRVGRQGDTVVRNSFWSGLNPLEALAHAKISYEALTESGKIWQPGYGYSKLVYNLHDIKVDYLGRLVDGKTVVEQHVLDALHHTDVLAEETFDYLLQEVLVKKNFGLA